jgi:putative radical SAM enzyme (TIGR03279 family)
MKQERKIVQVVEGSPAGLVGIREGDELVSVNDEAVQDVFDYRVKTHGTALNICIRRSEAKTLYFEISKDDEEDLGLVFETGLMDSPRSCENDCLFCFVAQNPAGVRNTLCLRDDDWRMSFLTGSYVTMTNMTGVDFKRLLGYRFSPVNISVHAVSPKVRVKLMRNERAGTLMRHLRALKRKKISMNFQIVLCRGINDGNVLINSIKKLAKLMPAASLSVVPVGLTDHRDGLHVIEPFTKDDARDVIITVQKLAERCKLKYKTLFVWVSDEFYLKAGLMIPDYEYYEGFPQLENGVGMLALFKHEFEEELENIPYITLNKTLYVRRRNSL